MKANKFFAVALAALTLVGFGACNKKEQPEALKLDPTSVTLKVGETATITANVGATWASNNEAVATVAPGNDGGKTALVTAVAEGTAIISATANGETKTCVVSVQNGGGQGGETHTITAKRIWPVVLDQVTFDKYASLVAGDFRPNSNDNNLWVWDETYSAGSGAGKNFFGQEGYTSLVVGTVGWSGCGYCVTNPDGVTAMETLRAAAVANPDKFFLHLAMKTAKAGDYTFYIFNVEEAGRAFSIGKTPVKLNESVFGDFTRDGEWHEFDVPMSLFTTALSSYTAKSGDNILCALAGGTPGVELNLDAVYFYEKN
jgi:hypothetical protein